ncbi:MAG: beta-ketoacyl synthase N-terminal-like domain-containing protein [Acidobacteriota bacterium]
MRKIGIFGWGIVAPRSENVEAFAANLGSSESWLSPFRGGGPNNFLVGDPKFDFSAYKGWIDNRFPPNRYPQLVEKMDQSTQYAVGAFIQALGQNPGLEEELTSLGTAAHVYVGTGLGALPTIYDISIAHHRAERRWNRFWSQPERNADLRRYLADPESFAEESLPESPEGLVAEERELAQAAWDRFWAARSDHLAGFLAAMREIEGQRVEGDVEAGKMRLMKSKRRRLARLKEEWGAPQPPWEAVSPKILWNIHNSPSAQISMLGRITGLSFAPVAACSTFGVSLKLAMDAIARGEIKAAVVGATDPAPHHLSVGGFYNARVTAADASVSKPLSELRGTHVSGGSALWIVGDWEHMTAKGFKPLGMEPVAVGVSADADHIITPSKEGPRAAVRQALDEAHVDPSEVSTWDLHATATPGDFLEVETLRGVLPDSVLVTARKGTFGHGMSACGGWELTAQYLGYARGELFPTPLETAELNGEISEVHQRFVFDCALAAPGGYAGKMSMGIGGINACVLSRPLSAE